MRFRSVQFLLDQGVRPNIQDLEGRTAMHHAVNAITKPGQYGTLSSRAYKVGTRTAPQLLLAVPLALTRTFDTPIITGWSEKGVEPFEHAAILRP